MGSGAVGGNARDQGRLAAELVARFGGDLPAVRQTFGEHTPAVAAALATRQRQQLQDLGVNGGLAMAPGANGWTMIRPAGPDGFPEFRQFIASAQAAHGRDWQRKLGLILPPVDLDAGSPRELMAAGFSHKEARQIVAHRELTGAFDIIEFPFSHPRSRALDVVDARAFNAEHLAQGRTETADEPSRARGPERLAVDELGEAVDLSSLTFRRDRWEDEHGKPVTPKVARDADDLRKVELHQHFNGIVDSEALVDLLFPDAQDKHAATVAFLRKMYGQDADGMRSRDATVRSGPGADPAQATGHLGRLLENPDGLSDQALLRAILTANVEMPFDTAYTARGVMIDVLIGKADPETGERLDGGPDPAKAEVYLRHALRTLRADGIDYAEPQGKWEMFNIPRDRLVEIFADEGVQLRFLHHRISERDLAAETDPEDWEAYKGELREKLRGREDLLGVTDVEDLPSRVVNAGLDICGPEWKPFTDKGMDRFKAMYEVLAELATKDQPLVLRPHVGEGYTKTREERDQGVVEADSVDQIRQSRPGADDKTANIARHNLDMLLSALEQTGHDKTRNVIVRFGHVTHVSPEQLQKMARMGIIAEVNMTSNLVTGAAVQASDTESRLDRHPVLALMAGGVDVVLSTDGHDVMHTTLTKEFRVAENLLRDFASGGATVVIPGHPEPLDIAGLSELKGAAWVEENMSVDALHRNAQAYRARMNGGQA